MFESLPFSRPATRQPLGHAVTAMSVHGALAVAAILGTRQVMEQPAPDGRDIILTPFVADPAPRAQTPASSDPLPVPAAPTAPSLSTVSAPPRRCRRSAWTCRPQFPWEWPLPGRLWT